MPLEGEQGDLLIARLLSTDAPSSPLLWPDVFQKRHPPYCRCLKVAKRKVGPETSQRRLVSVLCISDGLSHAQAATVWQARANTARSAFLKLLSYLSRLVGDDDGLHPRHVVLARLSP